MFFGFSDLAALRACIARDWTPTIGDPEITGWLTVISYVMCLVLAVMVLRVFWMSATTRICRPRGGRGPR